MKNNSHRLKNTSFKLYKLLLIGQYMNNIRQSCRQTLISVLQKILIFPLKLFNLPPLQKKEEGMILLKFRKVISSGNWTYIIIQEFKLIYQRSFSFLWFPTGLIFFYFFKISFLYICILELEVRQIFVHLRYFKIRL